MINGEISAPQKILVFFRDQFGGVLNRDRIDGRIIIELGQRVIIDEKTERYWVSSYGLLRTQSIPWVIDFTAFRDEVLGQALTISISASLRNTLISEINFQEAFEATKVQNAYVIGLN